MKIYCVQLILFLLTHKLTGARDEIFFQEEIIQPELFDLASKANLKENMLLEEIGYKVKFYFRFGLILVRNLFLYSFLKESKRVRRESDRKIAERASQTNVC
jgi:hypothetical protein